MAIVLCAVARTSQSVTVVSKAVTISTAVDYHITSTAPFTDSGTIDLRNENAAVIIDNVKPSIVKKNYLSHITVYGVVASHDINSRVGIYGNGTIIYPHSRVGFHPLTVYSEKNYGGDSSSDFELTQYYNGLGTWSNKIRSIKLRRGYMATLATDSDGNGYSRCFIAQDEDVEIADLGTYLGGRVDFIRIFPWNKVTKKGLGGTKSYNHLFNATWSWNWGANNVEYDDEEYVPSHEQENWPSFSSIMKIDKSNHLLGHCEPDNKVGEHITVADIEKTLFASGSWQRMYQTGMRVGSPAPGGGETSETVWLNEFMRLCKEYNCRIDYIVVHKYWYATGSQFNTQMNSFYNNWKLPIWITEWNYGANWTKEQWPDADRSATAKNYAHELAGIKDICTALEKNSHVERYSIYNWVQDCRKIYNDSDSTLESRNFMTPAGEWYANLKSNPAYSGGENYVMSWTYHAPSELTATYNKNTKRVILAWRHRNGKQTDSLYVERMIGGIDDNFKVIAAYPMTQTENMTYNYDDLSQYSGEIYYRIRDFDSDGRQRTSDKVLVYIGKAQGNSQIQYGNMKINSADAIPINFSNTFETTPAVFIGLPSSNTGNLTWGNIVSSVSKNRFNYAFVPWQYQTSGITSITSVEDADFMAMQYGSYHDGSRYLEVGSTKVKGDTARVLFQNPFPEGVTPIVITELKPLLTGNAISVHVWDITNTGFSVTSDYEIGANATIAAAQTLSYIAVTPGTFHFDDNIAITANNSTQPLYGAIARQILFLQTHDYDQKSDTLNFESPYIFGGLQTYNLNAATALKVSTRVEGKSTTEGAATCKGIRVVRISDDKSPAKNNSTSADTFAWLIVHKSDQQTVIESAPLVLPSDNDSVHRSAIYNLAGQRVENTIPGNIYIIGGKKVVIR